VRVGVPDGCCYQSLTSGNMTNEQKERCNVFQRELPLCEVKQVFRERSRDRQIVGNHPCEGFRERRYPHVPDLGPLSKGQLARQHPTKVGGGQERVLNHTCDNEAFAGLAGHRSVGDSVKRSFNRVEPSAGHR